MPNLIHSLDSCSLALVIDKLFKDDIKQFYSIHDCFAVTCNNVNTLTYILKNVYADIYSNESYIKSFHNSFLSNITNTYGKDSYNPINNTIIITKNDEPLIINIPDVNKIHNNNIIKLRESSYLIN
jgi:DNA-directed RNA polymerase